MFTSLAVYYLKMLMSLLTSGDTFLLANRRQNRPSAFS